MICTDPGCGKITEDATYDTHTPCWRHGGPLTKHKETFSCPRSRSVLHPEQALYTCSTDYKIRSLCLQPGYLQLMSNGIRAFRFYSGNQKEERLHSCTPRVFCTPALCSSLNTPDPATLCSLCTAFSYCQGRLLLSSFPCHLPRPRPKAAFMAKSLDVTSVSNGSHTPKSLLLYDPAATDKKHFSRAGFIL